MNDIAHLRRALSSALFWESLPGGFRARARLAELRVQVTRELYTVNDSIGDEAFGGFVGYVTKAAVQLVGGSRKDG